MPEERPLFAKVDPNREFTKKAVRYLISQKDTDDAASHILYKHFLKSEMFDDEAMSDNIEKQLTFRDQAQGEQLKALTMVAEMYRFLGREVYADFTNRPDAKSAELVNVLNKVRPALGLLFAPYIDIEGNRALEGALSLEEGFLTGEFFPDMSDDSRPH